MLTNLGILSARLGQHDHAKTYTQQALHIIRQIGDRHGERIALIQLGCCSHALGEYAEARTYHERPLVIPREIGDRKRRRSSRCT